MTDDRYENEDEIEEEQQGPAGLRRHARDLEKQLKAEREAREQEQAELAQYRREKAFVSAAKEAGIEGLTIEDVADMPEITATALKVRAKEREDARQTRLVEQARDLGFESVEEYTQFVADRKAQKEQRDKELAAAGAVAMSGGARPEPKSQADVMRETWVKGRQEGMPEDRRLAEAFKAISGEQQQ